MVDPVQKQYLWELFAAAMVGDWSCQDEVSGTFSSDWSDAEFVSRAEVYMQAAKCALQVWEHCADDLLRHY